MSHSATPTVLALDTGGARCSVAVAHGARVLVRRGAVGDTHLEQVLPQVDAVLRDAGLTVDDCAAFAFGAGPGSFTGVRVACTVAQGLAWARERPALAVSSLLALAVAADAGTPDRSGPSRLFCAIDARMGQAYAAVLEGSGLDWREVEPPFLCDLEDLPGRVARARVDAVAGDARWLAAQWAPGSPPPLCEACGDAEAIARWAQRAAASGLGVAPEQALPVYVRDQVAKTVAERAAERVVERGARGGAA